MRLVKATTECAFCDRKFHQIDGTEERALGIVRAALARHVEAEHPEAESVSERPLCRPAIAHWFDADADAEHRAMAQALCAHCPAAADCRALGQRAHGSGTYGGEQLIDGRPWRKRGPKPQLQEAS